jgi:ABC-2 type transport system permease protein
MSIAALIFSFMALFPTFAKDVGIMEKILENYPEEMLKAFGMSSGLPLSSVLGFLVFVFAFVQLCLAIQASNYGFSILSVEERELTADYLLSKPVSRVQILNAKLGASVLAIMLTNLIMGISTISAIEFYKDGSTYEIDKVLSLLLLSFVFSLVFFSIGILVSVTFRKIKSVLSLSMALAFGTYILNAVRAIVGGSLLGLISPFYHFDASYILDKGAVDFSVAWLSFLVIILSFVAVYLRYPKRDIHSL